MPGGRAPGGASGALWVPGGRRAPARGVRAPASAGAGRWAMQGLLAVLLGLGVLRAAFVGQFRASALSLHRSGGGDVYFAGSATNGAAAPQPKGPAAAGRGGVAAAPTAAGEALGEEVKGLKEGGASPADSPSKTGARAGAGAGAGAPPGWHRKRRRREAQPNVTKLPGKSDEWKPRGTSALEDFVQEAADRLGIPKSGCGEGAVQGGPNWKVMLAKEHLSGTSKQGDSKLFFLKGDGSTGHIDLDPVLQKALTDEDFAKGRRCHDTCALVGNSGTILGSGSGHEINEHDAVLRINFASTVGFEVDVGTRTAYDFANRKNIRERLAEVALQPREPPSEVLSYEITSRATRNKIYQPALERHGDKAAMHFLHPNFLTIATRFWTEAVQEIESINGEKYAEKPMSGYFALMYMLQVCGRVDLYGFEAFTRKKKKQGVPYRYFDDEPGKKVHSFDMALQLFRGMQKHFHIVVRDTKGS